MRRADAIHVRCPGNLGLLGTLMAPRYSRYLVAKYAGQWSGYPGEPWTVRMQRRLLASSWWKGPVTVYGRSPGQPDQVVPFFTSMLSAEQIRGASRRRPEGDARLRVLYVGRLSASKNVHVVLRAAAALKREGAPVVCSIVGEGPERQALERLSRELAIEGAVEFAGGAPFNRVLDFYASSDVLVLPSETEGWPKVVAEAMAFGLVCIASDRGFVREMLAEGRGLLVGPGDVEGVTRGLARVAAAPQAFDGMRAAAAEWSRRYSLEGLRQAIGELLTERWGVPVTPRAPVEGRQAEWAPA